MNWAPVFLNDRSKVVKNLWEVWIGDRPARAARFLRVATFGPASQSTAGASDDHPAMVAPFNRVIRR